MCGTCGCSSPDAATAHDQAFGGDRVIALERDLLAKNDAVAVRNRERLAKTDTTCVNVVSGPGAGKTTLLVATLKRLRAELACAVVEGDQAGDLDAAQVRATGVPAAQVNTGKACHLDAQMIAGSLDRGIAPAGGLLFIENVGNLVCPAGFDLGENARVIAAAVTDGDDKPLKYPDIFATAELVLVTKIDLRPYVAFDLERFTAHVRRVRPDAVILAVSAVTRSGLEAWLDWLACLRARRRAVA